MASQEQKKDYKVIKDFGGVNTKANRTSIKEEEFAWLENAMPVGHGNLKIVPAPTAIGGITFSGAVVYAAYGNIGTTNYYLAFHADGSAEVVNLSTNIKSTLAAAATFSASGVQCSQWNNTLVLIIDPVKGYFQWNGTNLVSVGAIGGYTITVPGTGYTTGSAITFSAPNQTGGQQATGTIIASGGIISGITITNPGTGYTSPPTIVSIAGGGASFAATFTLISQLGIAIASFSGRVWIANGRTIYYTAAGTSNDFITVSAGSIILNDATLIGNITQLVSANNFLYVFGVDSINVFSDVRVNSSGVTLFTNTNISASVGSDLSNGLMPYFRSIMFINRYGVYALVGSTTSKLSDSLDGVFPLIDFTQTVTCGQVIINNILCAAFAFTYIDPVAGSRPIQAVYFDKKWFFTSQGNTTFVVSIPVSGAAVLFGTTGTDLQKLYQSTATSISSTIKTSLLGMSDIIRDKQALKFGVEAILSNAVGNSITVTVDNENRSSPSVTLNNSSTVIWQNNSLATVSWINNSLAAVDWANYTLGYYLYRYDAQQWGKYIGLTITSTSPAFIVAGVQYETEMRARF